MIESSHSCVPRRTESHCLTSFSFNFPARIANHIIPYLKNYYGLRQLAKTSIRANNPGIDQDIGGGAQLHLAPRWEILDRRHQKARCRRRPAETIQGARGANCQRPSHTCSRRSQPAACAAARSCPGNACTTRTPSRRRRCTACHRYKS